ncbi:MAG: outer membrane protein assembly factor BamD [Bacteroidia bacterium]
MVRIFKHIIVVFAVVSGLLLASCGGDFSRLQKSSDAQTKYDAAMKYYKAADYLKAQQLFEQLLSIYRGTDKAEDISYYYAYCNYYLGDYVMGGFYFTTYARTYPHTKRAEECEFMKAFCEYLLSPTYSLDQTDTKKAIDAFQTFVDDYPNSDKIKECNKYIDILRGKLEKKYFEIAKGYYIIESYHAASTALANYIKSYPNSKYDEEAYYLIIKADYIYAVNSVEWQKRVRLQKVVEDYLKFVDAYPKSDYSKEAESLYNSTLAIQKNLAKS